MEKSFVFNSINGDRRYKAEDFREYFASFIGNGVFPNPSSQLQVISNDDMTITVRSGKGWISGAIYVNTEDLILNIDNADGVLNRIDRVVLKFDNLERNITCKVKKGVFASNPVAANLQRDADAYELCIAEIRVDKGVTSIVQSKITDTKLDTNLCGIVTQTIKEIDTTTLYNQLQAHIQEKGLEMDMWLKATKDYFTDWVSDTQNKYDDDFNIWFDSIKCILDGDVAGNLLNKINDLEKIVNNMKLESGSVLRPDGSNVELALLTNETSISTLEKNDGDLKDLQTASKTNLVSAINELFQNASNGKSIVATAIGEPLTSDDTFSAMGTKIDTLTHNFQDVLTSKDIEVLPTDKMSTLIDKVGQIRYFEGSQNVPKWYDYKFSNTWATASNVPTKRQQLTSSAIGSNIYVLGGRDAGNYSLNINECYDTLTNAWSVKTPIPTSRSGLTSSVVGSNIYVLGGYVGEYGVSNINECYDTLTDTWTTKAPMPTKRQQLTSSALDTNIYVLGGYDAGNYLNINECYDTLTDTWTTKAPMPTKRQQLTSSIVGSNIYVLGGATSNSLNINECYDTLTDTWTTKAPMSTFKQSLTSSTIGSNIYVLGGYSNNLFNANECYDTLTDTWTTKAPMPTARRLLTSSIVGSNIYVFGGNKEVVASDFGLNANECYIV